MSVQLLDSTGALVAETETDATGYFEFTYFEPGTYRLKFIAPSGFLFTPVNQGLDDSVDSDADTTGQTDLFTVAAGEARTNLDCGLTTDGTGAGLLGGKVWYDVNEDNIRQVGEPQPGSEVTIELLDAAGVVLQTTTPAIGGYFFFSVPAGTYRIRFIIPSQNGFVAANQGTDEEFDSDVTGGGTTELFTFNGDEEPYWDAGLTGPTP